MGYFDNVLAHEDKRNKGMNSTTNEKGADGKKNNSSEYNHQYYMKNKEKWKKVKGEVGTEKDWDDFDKLPEENRIGNSDFFGKKNADGTWTIYEEDMVWRLPKGVEVDADMEKALSNFKGFQDPNIKTGEDWDAAVEKILNAKNSKQEFDVDAAAKDVMSGKYKNGEERKKALGDDYKAVQKRVNELSAKHSDDDQNELYHHGIKGQKWGVRRFQNSDGTLTTAGKSRYGDKSDKVEKYSKKSAFWEGKAINAKTGLGREFATSMASGRRWKADKIADKATGDYNFFHLNKNSSRHLAATAEANANIAAGMKKRANSMTEAKAKRIMNKAVKRLATAENAETYAKKYKDVADAHIGKKLFTYIDHTVKDSTYTPAGRKRTFADQLTEGIGDGIVSYVFNLGSNEVKESVNNSMLSDGKKAAANIGINVAQAAVSTGAVTNGKDIVYRSKNSASKRWNTIVKG